MQKRIKYVELVLVVVACLCTSFCWGWEGNPLKLKRMHWDWKIGYTPLQLYTSSDLVGQARLDALEKLPEEEWIDGFSVRLSVVFTNVLKGNMGSYDILATPGSQDPDQADLSSFQDFQSYSEWAKNIGITNDWKWKVGESYILICATNFFSKRMELHSVVNQPWPEYIRELRKETRRYRDRCEEKATRLDELGKRRRMSREDMKLGDISKEEYERLSEGYRKEYRAISDEYDDKDPLVQWPDGRYGMYEQIDWGFLKKDLEGSK